MQTFLPLPDLRESVEALDPKRLEEQGDEAKQILDVLLNRPVKMKKPHQSYRNHPAVLMWRGHEEALAVYHNHCLTVRGAREGRSLPGLEPVTGKLVLPQWFGDEEFHASHRSQLLGEAQEAADKRDEWDTFDWYSEFLWTEIPGRIPYKWPVTARLEDLELIPLTKQPDTLGCSEISKSLIPCWDQNSGLLNFGLTTLRCFRAWESREELMAPDETIDVERNDQGVWCWVVKKV